MLVQTMAVVRWVGGMLLTLEFRSVGSSATRQHPTRPRPIRGTLLKRGRCGVGVGGGTGDCGHPTGGTRHLLQHLLGSVRNCLRLCAPVNLRIHRPLRWKDAVRNPSRCGKSNTADHLDHHLHHLGGHSLM